ncbi:protein AAR2 homolog [Cyclospora cayetanensis]|uniref:Protein AAR2 homolog n=1 Tax=Cyclospora cayetanensis TaxID=88456 RepID=A0A6P6RT58_9EIME|nr:protein AAR2 homolog [Cyclospora cayetanensis]
MAARALPLTSASTEGTGSAAAGSCCLLLLKTPANLLVGFDMAQWRVGEKFRGIRGIDPGCHFLHWTESDSSGAPNRVHAETRESECPYTRMRVDEAIGSTGQRGEFLYFDGRENKIIIRQWDTLLSRYLPLSEEETLRYVAGVEHQDFIDGLGVYPQHMRAQWRSLTQHISAACVHRVEPIGRCLEAEGMPLTKGEEAFIQKHAEERKSRASKKSAAPSAGAREADEEGPLDTPTPSLKREDAAAAEEANDAEKQESKDAVEAASCKMFYMDIRPPRSSAVSAARAAAAAARRSGVDAAAAAAEAAAVVTLQCTDRSDTLLQLLKEQEEGAKAILGELQMAFIALVLGHHYPSLLHWRALVELLSSSERAMYIQPDLFASFLNAFYSQLEQAPDEVTEGPLQEGSFLSSACAALLEICYSVDRSAAIQTLKSAAVAENAAKALHPDDGTGSMSGEVLVRRKEGEQGSAAHAGDASNAVYLAAAAAENELNASADAQVRALEPLYEEVEKAASRLCELARVLFKVTSGGGDWGEISTLDEVLLALQGPDAPVIVSVEEATVRPCSTASQGEEAIQTD